MGGGYEGGGALSQPAAVSLSTSETMFFMDDVAATFHLHGSITETVPEEPEGVGVWQGGQAGVRAGWLHVLFIAWAVGLGVGLGVGHERCGDGCGA